MYKQLGIWGSQPRNINFDQFLTQTGIYGKNPRLTPMDFERKFKKIENL
jgi:hypothetical protein